MESLNRPPLKLLFGTPEFLPAGVVQSTVRVGQKWRDDLAGKVAPRISCVDLDGTVLGTATVVGTLYGSFKDFAYIGSNVNHQENCRDVDGLIDVLSECYPDFNPETNVVTVIFFKYVSAVVEDAEEEDTADEETEEETDKTSDADEKEDGGE